MSPTRALLDGVLKYKRLYEKGDANHFIYRDQAGILEFCFGAAFTPNTEHKSIECQIMDLADDIAYSCFDIVDGSKARFITPRAARGARGQGPMLSSARILPCCATGWSRASFNPRSTV